MTAAAYNLLRMTRLLAPTEPRGTRRMWTNGQHQINPAAPMTPDHQLTSIPPQLVA
jgi:hypothetical protein